MYRKILIYTHPLETHAALEKVGLFNTIEQGPPVAEVNELGVDSDADVDEVMNGVDRVLADSQVLVDALEEEGLKIAVDVEKIMSALEERNEKLQDALGIGDIDLIEEDMEEELKELGLSAVGDEDDVDPDDELVALERELDAEVPTGNPITFLRDSYTDKENGENVELELEYEALLLETQAPTKRKAVAIKP